MTLAIVIPYFKFTFFESTLESLANQTDHRFKVYICDDASPESPSTLINKYSEQFDLLYHRFNNNLGSISLVQQWERCIALTENEEWLMILGDDDVLGNDVIQSWYKNFKHFNSKANVVRFSSKLIFEKSNSLSDLYTHPVWETATASFYRKFKQVSRSSLSEYIFSKATYTKYGFYNYPLAWNSDDHAWLNFSDGKPIYTINDSIVFVRMSTENITGRGDNIINKNLSQIQFYKYLISNKFQFYDNNQRLEIIKKYGKEIQRTRKVNMSEWIFISYYCLIFFNVGYLKKGFSMLSNK